MALMAVARALQHVLADAHPLPAEKIPLSDAFGRVLAEDLTALRTQPPAAVSAMDGYAVRAADVAATPLALKLIGEVAAGHPFNGEVKAGQTARIFTGGMMPKGSDTVIIQELATRDGDMVTFQKPAAKGRNVRDRGIDFARGQTLLREIDASVAHIRALGGRLLERNHVASRVARPLIIAVFCLFGIIPPVKRNPRGLPSLHLAIERMASSDFADQFQCERVAATSAARTA